MKVNPLLVTASIRNFEPHNWWREQIDFCDRLLLKNYWHMDLHPIARNFFLEHPEYTHYVVLAEDVIVTPDMVGLLIDDIENNDFPVIAGILNVDFTHDTASISFRDLRKIVVRSREVYKHPSFKPIVLKQYGFPFFEVKFQGNALVSYRRDVFKKLSFKPYRYVKDAVRLNYFGCDKPFGIMFDLQQCLDLLNLGIPIIVDVRLMVMHFAFGHSVINFAHLPRRVTLFKKDGTEEIIRRERPYRSKEFKPKKAVRKKLTREEFRRTFIGTPKKIKK